MTPNRTNIRNANASATRKDPGHISASKPESNEPKDPIRNDGLTSNAPTFVTSSLTSKKPTNNYDWLRPPKPQIINTTAQQKTANSVKESSKDSTSKSVNVVNKALSSISSSSSNSSSPINRLAHINP